MTNHRGRLAVTGTPLTSGAKKADVRNITASSYRNSSFATPKRITHADSAPSADSQSWPAPTDMPIAPVSQMLAAVVSLQRVQTPAASEWFQHR